MGTHYNGMHKDDLTATMVVDQLASGEAKISVTLTNTVDGEMYMIHAHDAADPSTTPNGTPYNETPNGNVLASMINCNGGMASTSQISTESFTSLTAVYKGFFVTQDPLQPIDTTNPTTYILLGLMAR